MKVSGDEVFDTLVLAMRSQHPDRNITLRDLIREAERRGTEFDISVRRSIKIPEKRLRSGSVGLVVQV